MKKFTKKDKENTNVVHMSYWLINFPTATALKSYFNMARHTRFEVEAKHD